MNRGNTMNETKNATTPELVTPTTKGHTPAGFTTAPTTNAVGTRAPIGDGITTATEFVAAKGTTPGTPATFTNNPTNANLPGNAALPLNNIQKNADGNTNLKPGNPKAV
jgi:hypothetical protein